MSKLSLSNVTMVCVNGTNDYLGSVKSLEHCLNLVSFKEAILFSPADLNHEHINNRIIKPLSWDTYNDFMIHELPNMIDSDYVLIVQEDGFIVNPDMWSDEFLDYDYVGALWSWQNVKTSRWLPQHIQQSNKLSIVGNGGFCLRSRKLLEACADCPHEVDGPEDAFICNVCRDYFEGCEIKFAPEEVANRFSFEQWSEYPNENPMNHFGIHGRRLQR